MGLPTNMTPPLWKSYPAILEDIGIICPGCGGMHGLTELRLLRLENAVISRTAGGRCLDAACKTPIATTDQGDLPLTVSLDAGVKLRGKWFRKGD